MFPVKFVDRNGNKIHIGNWVPVNNFFGHQMKSMAVLRKNYQEKMLPNLPLDSVARYSPSILQHMSREQLEFLERVVLFVKTPVSGKNIHYRINADNPRFFYYFHFRITKFAQRHNNQV